MHDLPPFLCCVSQGRHAVNVFSESSTAEALLGNGDFTHWIPEYRCTRKRAPSPYTLVYREEATCPLTVSQGDECIEVCGDLRHFRGGVPLAYLAYGLMEVQRQAEGQTTSHVAALSSSGKGILLFGRPGSGKTSVGLALCRERGFSLIANDLGLLGRDEDGISAHGGTKFFYLRRAAMEKHHPDLLRFFGRPGQEASWLFSPEEQADPWITRTTVFPDQIGVAVEHQSVRVARAFFLHLDPAYTRIIANRMTGIFPRLFLYENLSRTIRGTGSPFLGSPDHEFLAYLSPRDHPEFHERRVAFIEHLLRVMGLEHVSGNLTDITEYICAAVDAA